MHVTARNPGRVGLVLGLLGLALLPAAASAQAVLEGPGMPYDLNQTELATTHIGGQVHMLTGIGGNIGVFAGADGVILIDDKFETLSDSILEAVGGISDQPVRFLLNTHFHGDHTGSNANLAETGVVIVAHDNVRRTLAAPHVIEVINTTFKAYGPGGLPIITFSDEVTFHLNGEETQVFHLPNAHTDGDSVIYFRGSDVLAAGDIFQRKGYPVVDRRNGGSFIGLIAAWDRLLTMIGKDTRILQGHGGVATRDDLQKARDGLVTIRDRIAELIAQGASVDEVIAANPTAGPGDHWPQRPAPREQIVAWFYAELAG